MIRGVTIYIAALILLAASAGCAQTNPEEEISIAELKQMMQSNDSLVVLDVRTEQELVGPLGKLEGIVHIPVQELDTRINEMEKYKGNKIAVVCRTGNRSGRATKILRANGYDAYNVKGGMTAYRQSE